MAPGGWALRAFFVAVALAAPPVSIDPSCDDVDVSAGELSLLQVRAGQQEKNGRDGREAGSSAAALAHGHSELPGTECWRDDATGPWDPSCHDALSQGVKPHNQIVRFFAKMSFYTYCDFWDQDVGDLSADESMQYLGQLAGKVQGEWRKVCGQITDATDAAACNSLGVSVFTPRTGATLLYFFTRLTAPDGRLLLLVTFRGTRPLVADDWNVDLSDPCPRERDPASFDVVDASSAESGSCPELDDDSGFRVAGSVGSTYQEEIREQLLADLMYVLNEDRARKVELLFVGHSLGGALAQVLAADLVYSKALEPFLGRTQVVVVTFMGPRILGRQAARTTMEGISSLHEAFVQAEGAASLLDPLASLGLTWQGFAWRDPEDVITAWPPQQLLDDLESTGIRRVLSVVNAYGGQGPIPGMACIAESDDLQRLAMASPGPVFERGTGAYVGGAVRLPARDYIAKAWSKYYALPMPLLNVVASVTASLSSMVIGGLGHHAQVLDVMEADFLMSSTTEMGMRMFGGECPVPRAHCSCPFRKVAGPKGGFVAWLSRGGKHCGLIQNALRCDLAGSQASQFRIIGTCGSGTHVATISLSVYDGKSWLPCGIDATSGLHCGAGVEASTFGLELLSTGLSRKMSTRLILGAPVAGEKQRSGDFNMVVTQFSG